MSFLLIDSSTKKPNIWPPAKRSPYTLPPYTGDRDLWFIPPTQPDIRFVRGDEWSVEIPGLPYLPGLTSLEYPDRCFTGFYPMWNESWRQSIRQAHINRGYTHFTLWLGDIYNWLHLTPQQLLNYCLELRKSGFYIRAWLGSKLYPQWIPMNGHIQDWKTRLDPYLDLLLQNDCLHHAVMGGEYDLWNIGDPNESTPFQITDYLVQKCSKFNCLVYFHFSTHVTFWGNTPGSYNNKTINDRFDWYRIMCDTGLRGIGYQGECPRNWDIPMMQARIADTLGKADSRFDIVLEEPGPADAQFPANAHPNEVDACAIGYAGVITKPANGQTNVHIMGYSNGGYQPSGLYL